MEQKHEPNPPTKSNVLIFNYVIIVIIENDFVTFIERDSLGSFYL